MKAILPLILLVWSCFTAKSQDSNVLIGLGTPIFGVKIKANFPGATSDWARGYYVVNENNSQNFFGIGALGGVVNGVSNLYHGWIGQDYNNAYMYFLPTGNIGIGTATPKEKLSVNGNIRAHEIKVETTSWPDYVFEDDYKISSLTDIAKYIKIHKHLPEMPSAKTVAVDGVALGEMNKLLLKKIEELTLHLIQQNERLAEQEKRALKQDQKIAQLSSLIENIKK